MIVVRRADVGEILPLRHAVLRPGYPESASVYPQDAVAVHVGAWDGEQLVGCASTFPDRWPAEPAQQAGPGEPAAWRLRGMAVEPSRQGAGIGRLVLAGIVEAAVEGGAPFLWANARVSALDFYQRLGWRSAGGEFVAAETGIPHVQIVRDLTDSGSVS